MIAFYKSTRPDGRDFYTGTVDYAAALTSGEPIIAPPCDNHDFPGPKWLHLATVPTQCVGMSWPCRLFEVEPADDLGEDRPRGAYKVGATSVRVLREIEAHRVFGPQGERVVALIERCRTSSAAEVVTVSIGVATAEPGAGDDHAAFVAAALSPARVQSVEIVDAQARTARVVVPDYQLSLAIGKEGQNARLAAKLTGWRIDIRSDTAPTPAPDGGPRAGTDALD